MIIRSKALIILLATSWLIPTGLHHAVAKPVADEASPKTGLAVTDTYLVGPGDKLIVELLNIPDLSGSFTVGPDGTLYLPRLRALYVEGLTIEEIRHFLTQQYKTYIKDPQVYVSPIGYRPVRVYVGGEVGRPGYYLLSSSQAVEDELEVSQSLTNTGISLSSVSQSGNLSIIQGGSTDNKSLRWPTLFDALRAAQGVTPYSNLSQVQITRKKPLSMGGGKMRANVDFLQLVNSGDESVNIRLFDGDSIEVLRSTQVMREQLLAASRSNLSPDFIEVFVSGRVKEPGAKNLPQGATLNQAIASAGGPKLLRGGIEFLRFTPDGRIDRRRFSYNSSAGVDDYKNPVLMTGDVVRVNDSLFSAGVEVLNEITGPAVGIYSVYSLFKP